MTKFRIPNKSTYFSSDLITHLQMVDEIMEFALKWGRLIGAGLLDQDYKTANKTIIFVVLLLILTCTINIYDIYLFREDVIRCVFCLLTFSAGIQSFAKCYTFLWMRNNILNLRKQSEKFHEHFSSLKSSKIFEEKFMIAAHVIAGLSVLYITAFILIAIYPIIFYFIMNERILHFGIELPLIDWKNSWIGYGINFGYQILIVSIFFCGSIVSLCIIICFMTSGIGQFDVLDILLDELNELAIKNDKGEKNDEIRKKIKFLIQTHTNLMEFIHKMRQTFAPYYFFEFFGLIFQKTVELFAIISVSSIIN